MPKKNAAVAPAANALVPPAELAAKLSAGVPISAAEAAEAQSFVDAVIAAGALSDPSNLSFVVALAKAPRVSGARAEPPPAFLSVGPGEAAALSQAKRKAYLEQATGYSLAFAPIAFDHIESVAGFVARKTGAAVTITHEGREVMSIAPDHGKADNAGGTKRAAGTPTTLQQAIIEACSRQDEYGNTLGATSEELHAATGLTDPQSWSQKAQACQGFGYSYWTSTNAKGKRVYHLDPVAEGEGADEGAAAEGGTEPQAAE